MQLYSQPPRQSFSPTIIPDDVPVYKILDGRFYDGEELFEAGSVIAWQFEPNEEMLPLNAMAKEAHKAFFDKIDRHGEEAARANGKSYVSRGKAFENAMQLAVKEGRRATLLNGETVTPMMGRAKDSDDRAKRVDIVNEPTVPIMAGRTKRQNLELI